LLALLASLFLGCGFEIDNLWRENAIIYEKCGDKLYNPISEYCVSEVKVIEPETSEINFIAVDKGEFIDSRDNRVYKYVSIGTQTWMAENLRYETANTKCYDNDPENCETYGILYDWNTAKTACPSGWHLPNDTEWFTLRRLAKDIRLMANSVLWESGKGTDDFGFAALPGGYYRHESYFLNIKETAVFWSATAGSIEGSAHDHLFTLDPRIREIDGLYTYNSWVNVRCVKD